MEPQNQAYNQPTNPTLGHPSAQPEPKQKNKSTPAIVILAILAVLGFGFGGYEFWQNNQKDEKIQSLEDNKTVAEEVVEVVEKAEVFPIETLQQTLADKYGAKATGTTTFANDFYSSLSNYNKLAREHIVAQKFVSTSCDQSEAVQNGTFLLCTVSYETFVAAYQKLFGNFDEIERADIIFSENEHAIMPKAVYNAENDSFGIYLANGVGGFSTETIIYKVIDAAKAEDTIKATVVTSIVNAEVKLSNSIINTRSCNEKTCIYGNMSEDQLQDIYNETYAYVFTFREYNGGYVLTEVEKLN